MHGRLRILTFHIYFVDRTETADSQLKVRKEVAMHTIHLSRRHSNRREEKGKGKERAIPKDH